ncbi:MAG: NAD-dependent epimerase/dehydratase family protein [Thermaerobacterales bacterium]
MRVLVAGGTRFIGRTLVKFLLAEGHDVTLFHRGQSGRDLFPEAGRIFGDRADPPEPLGKTDWDWVFDLSGYTPIEVETLLRRLGGRAGRYIFCSTGSVYAGRNEGVIAEDGERWPYTRENIQERPGPAYGAKKAEAERSLMRLAPALGIEAVIVRPVLVYGPHDPTDRVLYWLHRVAHGLVYVPATHDGITHTVYVKDLARLFVAAAKVPGAAGQAYNAAATSPPTLRNLIAAVAERVGIEPEIRTIPVARLRGAGLALPVCTGGSDWFVDTAKIQKTFGHISTPLDESVADTLAYYRRGDRQINEAVSLDQLAALAG